MAGGWAQWPEVGLGKPNLPVKTLVSFNSIPKTETLTPQILQNGLGEGLSLRAAKS